MSAVWDLDLPDSDKIVLLALADCANDEGHCWPGMKSLVRKCSKSERTIQGCIKRLVDEGHLTRLEVIGKGCNYTIHPNRSRIDTPAAAAPRKDCAPQPLRHPPAAAAGKPSKNHQSEAKASSQRAVDHYNLAAKKHGWPAVRVLDASRRQQLRLREKAVGENGLIEAIDAMAASPFLRGKGKEDGWKPDFDFLLQPLSLRRLLEGFYGADAPLKQLSADDRRAELLRRATFYDSINQPDQAADCRRRAVAYDENEPASVGALASAAIASVGRAA